MKMRHSNPAPRLNVSPVKRRRTRVHGIRKEDARPTPRIAYGMLGIGVGARRPRRACGNHGAHRGRDVEPGVTIEGSRVFSRVCECHLYGWECLFEEVVRRVRDHLERNGANHTPGSDCLDIVPHGIRRRDAVQLPHEHIERTR